MFEFEIIFDYKSNVEKLFDRYIVLVTEKTELKINENHLI